MANDLSSVASGDMSSLNLNQIREYLLATNWIPKPKTADGLVDLFERPGDRLSQVRIPIAANLDDFSGVLARSLFIIARYERRSAEEVYDDILFYADDVMTVREVSADTASGTVAFSRARDIFSGIR